MISALSCLNSFIITSFSTLVKSFISACRASYSNSNSSISIRYSSSAWSRRRNSSVWRDCKVLIWSFKDCSAISCALIMLRTSYCDLPNTTRRRRTSPISFQCFKQNARIFCLMLLSLYVRIESILKIHHGRFKVLRLSGWIFSIGTNNSA